MEEHITAVMEHAIKRLRIKCAGIHSLLHRDDFVIVLRVKTIKILAVLTTTSSGNSLKTI